MTDARTMQPALPGRHTGVCGGKGVTEISGEHYAILFLLRRIGGNTVR